LYEKNPLWEMPDAYLWKILVVTMSYFNTIKFKQFLVYIYHYWEQSYFNDIDTVHMEQKYNIIM
jgi:uncharacterized protein YkuJ